MCSVAYVDELLHIHCVSIKSSLFYSCDNFPNCKSIQIIFGRNIAEKMWNRLTCGNFDILFIMRRLFTS